MWCGRGNQQQDLCDIETPLNENSLLKLFQKPSTRDDHVQSLLINLKTRFPKVFTLNRLVKVFNRVIKRADSDKPDEPRSKHVMFADSLGLDLELIHTIQINSQAGDQLDKLITKQSFVSSYNQLNMPCVAKIGTNSGHHVNSDKMVIPKFALSPDRNYEKLIKNGICLNSIEVYNQSSIRGLILTLTKSRDPNCVDSPVSYYENSRMTVCEGKKERLSKTKHARISRSELDIVYIIWSVDEWANWKYQAAIKNNCRTLKPNKGIIKTYEFFLQDLDLKLRIGQTLQLIICHQIDLVVFKDTNNERCYKFECAVKI